MTQGRKLHPSVSKFKEFVAENPHLIRDVRNGDTTWQQLYEEWYLLGEEDSRWNKSSGVKKEEVEDDSSKKDWMGQLAELAKKVEPGQIQSHLYNLSQALGAIQGLIGQFQQQPIQQAPPSEPIPQHPFPFRKD
ncbi:YlbD family protein [Bacillus sp. EB01]|uniref:YlbD family protein n=1 Tax=Bacillus sp. EB01 TaxID=1347086 RepID=UPI0005C597C7|nr:YlbD family protein [Bacillus sp. EB01]